VAQFLQLNGPVLRILTNVFVQFVQQIVTFTEAKKATQNGVTLGVWASLCIAGVPGTKSFINLVIDVIGLFSLVFVD